MDVDREKRRSSAGSPQKTRRCWMLSQQQRGFSCGHVGGGQLSVRIGTWIRAAVVKAARSRKTQSENQLPVYQYIPVNLA